VLNVAPRSWSVFPRYETLCRSVILNRHRSHWMILLLRRNQSFLNNQRADIRARSPNGLQACLNRRWQIIDGLTFMLWIQESRSRTTPSASISTWMQTLLLKKNCGRGRWLEKISELVKSYRSGRITMEVQLKCYDSGCDLDIGSHKAIVMKTSVLWARFIPKIVKLSSRCILTSTPESQILGASRAASPNLINC
jgi:hypothetical protein